MLLSQEVGYASLTCTRYTRLHAKTTQLLKWIVLVFSEKIPHLLSIHLELKNNNTSKDKENGGGSDT